MNLLLDGWLAMASASTALAAGASTDTELVALPTAPRAGFGTDSPFRLPSNAWRLGALVQYEQEPLVLYDDGERVGDVIGQRASVQVAGAVQPNPALSFRARLPVVGQWGSQVDALAADRVAFGDLVVGIRVHAVDAPHAGLAFGVDQHVPTGARDAWIGDAAWWRSYAVVGGVRGDQGHVVGDVEYAERDAVDTSSGPTFGRELRAGIAARYDVRGHVGLTGEVLARHGLTDGLRSGLTPVEGIVGVRALATSNLAISVGAAVGLTRGYGTSRGRALVAFAWAPPEKREATPPPTEPPPAPPAVAEAPPLPPDVVVDVPWVEGQLARVEGDQIVIREPILFELGTDHILPQSLPVLDAVAALMDGNDRIAHVVIEGHASQEGSFSANYDLSIRRAKAVFERLVAVGVDAERLSYRGMGEVVPAAAGADDLEANRRVVFHIVHQLDPLEVAPPRTPDAKLPWNGEPQPAPAAPAPGSPP